MVAKLGKWGARLFPERQILVRTEGRMSYITLTRRTQITAATGIVLGLAAISYLVVGYVHFGHVISAKQAQVARAESSNRELRRHLSDLQSQLAMATAQIDGTQYRLDVIGSEYGTLQGSLSDTEQALQGIVDARSQLIAERDDLLAQLQQAQDDATSKADYAAQLAQSLQQNKSELTQTEAQRRTLNSRLQQLEKDMQASNSRSAEFKAALENTQAKLQQISGERERIIAERERLAAERDALKQKLQSIEASLSKTDTSKADTSKSDSPKADTSSKADTKTSTSLASLPRQTLSKMDGVFGNLENMVAATGLNVENFIARLGGPAKGEGGPYIALGAPNQVSSEQQSAREETLRKLLKALPLAAPLGQYQLESPFGTRIDPINHRQGFHPGVDLISAFRSPVYSTAPGVVTFAGPRDTYGKFVEIDHGNGIVTHYAHLHRVTVARGQRVGAHQEVGELGSTGRSTGPHLHYEVVVDGEPLDPEKFLEVGKSVVQVKRN